MCIFFLKRNAKDYKLIIASNRDELITRETSPASEYLVDDKKIISPIDLTANGTWIGTTTTRFAILTNIKDDPSSNVESRGCLVKDALLKRKNSKPHRGYNLVYGDYSGHIYYQTHPKDVKLEACEFGTIENIDSKDEFIKVKILDDWLVVSNNNLFDEPWEKQRKGRRLFKDIVEKGLQRNQLEEALFQLLQHERNESDTLKTIDQSTVVDESYLDRNLTNDIFVNPKNGYGTRTMTVLILDLNNNLRYVEKDLFTKHSRVFEFKVE
jgi:uncharacterized protein with NRDE domain